MSQERGLLGKARSGYALEVGHVVGEKQSKSILWPPDRSARHR